jgi:hypothetical protein
MCKLFYVNSVGTVVSAVMHYSDNPQLMKFQTYTVKRSSNNTLEMHAKFILAGKKDEGGGRILLC